MWQPIPPPCDSIDEANSVGNAEFIPLFPSFFANLLLTEGKMGDIIRTKLILEERRSYHEKDERYDDGYDDVHVRHAHFFRCIFFR